MLKLLFLLTLVSLLSACAPTLHKGPTFKTAPSPTEKEALIYIYRPHAPPLWRSPTIYFNDTEIVDLYNHGYSYIYASPGTYQLLSDWSFDAGPPDLKGEMTFQGGKTYYIRMTGRMGFSSSTITTSSKIEKLSSEQVLSDISHCMYIKPKLARIK